MRKLGITCGEGGGSLRARGNDTDVEGWHDDHHPFGNNRLTSVVHNADLWKDDDRKGGRRLLKSMVYI